MPKSSITVPLSALRLAEPEPLTVPLSSLTLAPELPEPAQTREPLRAAHVSTARGPALAPSHGPVAAGNIELFGRPKITNPAGGTSTVFSMSFRDEDPESPYFGKEVLVPRADEGRILSEDEAVKKYYRTGKHLGVFASPESADAYAEQLHNEYAAGKYDAPVKRRASVSTRETFRVQAQPAYAPARSTPLAPLTGPISDDTDLDAVLSRQRKDTAAYGAFMKRGAAVVNRTDAGRHRDSERFIADYLRDRDDDSAVVIDIGSGLGNPTKDLAGATVRDLKANKTIAKKAIVVATDIDSEARRWKDLPLDVAVIPSDFTIPVRAIADARNKKSEVVILRAANSIDLLMNEAQTTTHLENIAEQFPDKEVVYIFNRHILRKPVKQPTFDVIGEIAPQGFDHRGASWTDTKHEPYVLRAAADQSGLTDLEREVIAGSPPRQVRRFEPSLIAPPVSSRAVPIEPASEGEWTDPKTGMSYPRAKAGEHPLDFPFVSSQKIGRGVKAVGEVLAHPPVLPPEPHLPPATPEADAKLLNAASDIMEGGAGALTPLVVVGALANLPGTALTLGASYLAAKGAERAAIAANASPPMQRFLSNLAGAATAMKGGAKIASGLRAASKVASETARAGVLATSMGVKTQGTPGDIMTRVPPAFEEPITVPRQGETLTEVVRTVLAPEPPPLVRPGPPKEAPGPAPVIPEVPRPAPRLVPPNPLVEAGATLTTDQEGRPILTVPVEALSSPERPAASPSAAPISPQAKAAPSAPTAATAGAQPSTRPEVLPAEDTGVALPGDDPMTDRLLRGDPEMATIPGRVLAEQERVAEENENIRIRHAEDGIDTGPMPDSSRVFWELRRRQEWVYLEQKERNGEYPLTARDRVRLEGYRLRYAKHAEAASPLEVAGASASTAAPDDAVSFPSTGTPDTQTVGAITGESQPAPPDVPQPTPAPAPQGPQPTIRYNAGRESIEIGWPKAPARDVIDRLKAAGFRWAKNSRVWYRAQKGIPEAQQLADVQGLVGLSPQAEEIVTPSRPSKFPAIYSRTFLNEDGTTSTVAEIIAQQQREGVPQAEIDRWVQGLERGEQPRQPAAAPAAEEPARLADAAEPEAPVPHERPDQPPIVTPIAPSVSPEQIPRELANRAHSGTSWVPEDRGAMEQREYVRHMNGVWAFLQAKAKTSEQQALARTEFERYRSNYVSRYRQLLASRGTLISAFIAGPSKFPRRQQEKRQSGYERRLNDFLAWDTRARSAMVQAFAPTEARAVSADRADAPDVLRAKVEKAQRMQETMKGINVVVKDKRLTADQKVAAIVAQFQFKESTARKLLEPDFAGRIGFPDYELRNNLANIKRMEARIGSIGAMRSTAERSATFEGGVVEENARQNRLQITFNGKPSTEMRDKLKAAGFHWSPRAGAWQRQRTENAVGAAERLLGVKLSAPETEAVAGEPDDAITTPTPLPPDEEGAKPAVVSQPQTTEAPREAVSAVPSTGTETAAENATPVFAEPPQMAWRGPKGAEATALMNKAAREKAKSEEEYKPIQELRYRRDRHRRNSKKWVAADAEFRALEQPWRDRLQKAESLHDAAKDMALQQSLAKPDLPPEARWVLTEKLADHRGEKLSARAADVIQDEAAARLKTEGFNDDEATRHGREIAWKLVSAPMTAANWLDKAIPAAMKGIELDRVRKVGREALRTLLAGGGVGIGHTSGFESRIHEAQTQKEIDAILREAETALKGERKRRTEEREEAKRKVREAEANLSPEARAERDSEFMTKAVIFQSKGRLVWRRPQAGYWEPMEGRPADVEGAPEGYAFSVFRDNGWHVVENSTGVALGEGDSAEEAVRNATEMLAKHGHEKFRDAVAKELKDVGPRPELPRGVKVGKTPAPVKAAPVEQEPEIETPAEAAVDVNEEIRHVIDTKGTKSARDVQMKVLAALKAELPAAMTLAGRGSVDGEMPAAPKPITIEIPGDGTFTIERTPQAIQGVMKRITSAGAAPWKGLTEEKKGRPAIAKLQEIEDAAKQRIADRGTFKGGRLTAGLPVDDMTDIVIIGAAKIAKGTVRFAEWSHAMVVEFGNRIRPHLREIWDLAQRKAQEFGPMPVYADSGREVPPTKPIPDARVLEFPSVEKMPEAIRDDIADLLARYGGFEAQRRGVQTWARTEALSKDVWLPLETLKPGRALNAEELNAYQTAIATALTERKPILERIQDGTATDWDRLQASHLTDVATILTASYRGAKAEAGRALNILRAKARVLDLQESAFLEAALKAPGFQQDVARISREALEAAGDPLKQLNLLRRRSGTFYDRLLALYYANLLSGIKTHLRNIIGNTVNLMANTLVPVGAVPFDVARRLRTGQSRTVYLSELPHALVGGFIGTQAGIKNAAFTFVQGFRPSTVDAAAAGVFDEPRVELPGGLLNPFNHPARALEASDEFFRAVARSQELYAGAYVQARNEGLTDGKAISARMAEILTATDGEDGRVAEGLSARAGRFAARSVFQEETGPAMSWLLKAKARTSPMALRVPATFIAPFMRIGGAIMRQGLEWTPAGFVMKGARSSGGGGRGGSGAGGSGRRGEPWDNGREQSQAVGRALLGSLLLLPLAWLASTGRLTGAPPSNPGEREEFYAQGKLANAVKIGKYWVRYVLFQPYSVAMAAVANAWQRFERSDRSESAAEEAWAVALTGAGASLMDQSFLAGLGSLTDAINDPDRYAGQWLSLFSQGFVPFSGLARNVSQAADPVYRRPQGVNESVQAIIPGASDTLPARRTRFGEEARRVGPWWQRGFVVPEVSKAIDDRVTQTLARVGYRPTVPKGELTVRGEKVRLTPAQEAVLVEAFGRERKAALEALLAKPGFSRLSDEHARELLENGAAVSRRMVAARALRALGRKDSFTLERLVSVGVVRQLERDRHTFMGRDITEGARALDR